MQTKFEKSSTGFIQTPKEEEYLKSSMPGIKRFYYVDQNDLKQSRDRLVKRFDRSKVIKETRKMHASISVRDTVSKILVKTTSSTNRCVSKTLLGGITFINDFLS